MGHVFGEVVCWTIKTGNDGTEWFVRFVDFW